MWFAATLLLFGTVHGALATHCDFPQSLCFDSEAVLENLSLLEAAVAGGGAPSEEDVTPADLLALVNSIKASVKQSLSYETCADVPAGSPSGLYLLRGEFREARYAYCDMEYNGGGWLVFQNRFNGQTNFHLTWSMYQSGFGNMESGEFWWGLDNLYRQTNIAPHELVIVLEDFDGVQFEAKYSDFQIGDAAENYRLNVLGTYSGLTDGDSLRRHKNMMFTTIDKDNDTHMANCAVTMTGAWWYAACQDSNLNGRYLGGPTQVYGQGMVWLGFRGQNYSLKKSRMMIRRKPSAEV